MSIGNVTQSISFDTQPLVLVRGENLDIEGISGGNTNGVGKSTIGNALSFALYGNALSNIRKDNLVNKINSKNMLVTLTFEKNGVNYRIERGRKPSVMRLYVNNIEQSEITDDAQGDNRETQKDLTELLGMSHEMFKHIVALNTYTEPFLSLRPADQRPIIEQLLGVTQLSEKAAELSNQLKQTKELINLETAKIDATTVANDRIQHAIDSLSLRQTAWVNQKTDTLEKIAKNIVELENINIEHELKLHADMSAFIEYRNKTTSLIKDRSILDAAKNQTSKLITKYKTDIDNLKTTNRCNTCDQELHVDKHNEIIESITAQMAESVTQYDQLTAEHDEINKKINELGEMSPPPATYYSSLDQALRHQNNLNNALSQYELKTNEEDPYQNQIDEMRNVAIQPVCWDEVNTLTEFKSHQELLLKLLTNKDSFIRKKIIDQNLAYLNTRLSFYLTKMGLPHQVVFLNDLNVEITQLGQNLDFHNLSRGEMNRLILSTSWSFRDVWENMVDSVNLMFIDELVDNGLDASGVENALGVLKSIARDRNKNVFLISHKEELLGRVNNVLTVTKEGGFTSFSEESSMGDID